MRGHRLTRVRLVSHIAMMSHPNDVDFDPVHDEHIDRLVRADKLRLLYHQSFPALFVSILVASLLCLMLWDEVPDSLLVGWWSAIVASACLRLGLFVAYFRLDPGVDHLPGWERPYAATLILSSLVWGLGAVIVMPTAPLLHQVITMYIMIGLAGGAISTYSSYRVMALGSMLSVLLPPALWMLWQGGIIPVSLAMAALIYIFASLRATGVLSRALHRSFQLTHALKYAHDASARQARTDTLTGLNNRRALFEQGAQLFSYCERSNVPVSVVMLDVDHFKSINDTFGHATGDAALRHLARLLQASLRKSDLCGRIGGEEFVVLLPDTALESACILAEKLRQTIIAHPFQHQGITHSFTVSLGVSSGAGSLEHLVHQADLALYRAKNEGRNRVVCEEGDQASRRSSAS